MISCFIIGNLYIYIYIYIYIPMYLYMDARKVYTKNTPNTPTKTFRTFLNILDDMFGLAYFFLSSTNTRPGGRHAP